MITQMVSEESFGHLRDLAISSLGTVLEHGLQMEMDRLAICFL